MMQKLILGDCLEKMKGIPDESVDCFICDPPYGQTPLKWDKLLDFKLLWGELDRICKKNAAILLFGQEPFSSYLRLSNILLYKYDWYWQKERLTNVFQVKRRPGRVVETVSVFYKEQPTYQPQKQKHEGKLVSNKIGENARWSETMAGANPKTKPLEYFDDGTRHPLQVLKIKRDNCRKLLHPTQKPLELLEYFVKTYTKEGDVVLDCCIGSGTTCLAAKNLGRQFIGIEKEEKYYNIAHKRIFGENVPLNVI
jgi:site-specific DNA-methyltransferase (adenine-specific)